MKRQKKVVLAVCPCGSGRPVHECHVDVDGRLRKHVPSLRPPGPLTGYAHPGCYLQSTNDCSQQISGEHYISKAVLQRLGETLSLSGGHWQELGQVQMLPLAGMKAKILCRRHNSALSPLDSEADLFFSTIIHAQGDLYRKTLSRKPVFHLVSGDALELWMLKIACGLFFGVGADGDGAKLSASHSIDMQKVTRAFFERRWDDRGGLYFKATPGDAVTSGPAVPPIAMAMLSDAGTKRCSGAELSLVGFTMRVFFDTSDIINPEAWRGLVWRPTELLWSKKPRQHHLILTWPPWTPEASITFLAAGRTRARAAAAQQAHDRWRARLNARKSE